MEEVAVEPVVKIVMGQDVKIVNLYFTLVQICPDLS